MEEKGNEDMHYFYETRIKELKNKIRQAKDFISSIENRIKKEIEKQEAKVETAPIQQSNVG